MRRTMILLSATVLAAVSCADATQKKNARYMSERFELCINIPDKSRYQLVKESIDYDTGQLFMNGNKVDVYIGQNPPFSGPVWSKGENVTPGFILVGKETVGGVQKILIGHKRYARRGPLFVMFSGKNIADMEKYLVEEDFVFDCSVADETGSENEKWRQH
jgi:hypothetical protein